jgi:RimJ/RimL family protein N-acetyltransferase
MILLDTERLRLRSWTEADLEPFAALNADPAVMAYFPARLDRRQSDETAKRFQRMLELQAFGFTAVETKADGRFIGYVGLSPVEIPVPFIPAVEVAWRLAASSWGHGYASEAARAWLDHGFSAMGLEEIVAFTTRTNLRSIAVMERIGMTRDQAGDFDHPRLAPGDPLRPHVLYRIAKPAWQAAR